MLGKLIGYCDREILGGGMVSGGRNTMIVIFKS